MHAVTRNFCLTMLGACLLAACSAIQPTPVAGELRISAKDGMRLHYVPSGAFMMGNDNGWEGQKPAHEVNLEAFWIDETEVTNGMYAQCVQAGACVVPPNTSSYTHDNYFLEPEYANYPVLYLSWQDAKTYCTWAGRELPSEAQWEKAARGSDGRLYPWGNQPPDKALLNNFDVSFLEDTGEVGSYPQGASPYGALDMAGNVWEWVADWFQPYPGGNPAASQNYGDIYRVLRGGSFVDPADATTRYENDPELRNYDIGFRCVLPEASSGG